LKRIRFEEEKIERGGGRRGRNRPEPTRKSIGIEKTRNEGAALTVGAEPTKEGGERPYSL